MERSISEENVYIFTEWPYSGNKEDPISRLEKLLREEINKPLINPNSHLGKIDLSEKIALDVGCGPGLKSVRLAKCCKWVVGIDASDTAIKVGVELARRFSLNNLLFINCFIENMEAELISIILNK